MYSCDKRPRYEYWGKFKLKRRLIAAFAVNYLDSLKYIEKRGNETRKRERKQALETGNTFYNKCLLLYHSRNQVIIGGHSLLT
jgi:hypothetical protein